MLAHRLRLWASIESTMVQRFVFAEVRIVYNCVSRTRRVIALAVRYATKVRAGKTMADATRKLNISSAYERNST